MHGVTLWRTDQLSDWRKSAVGTREESPVGGDLFIPIIQLRRVKQNRETEGSGSNVREADKDDLRPPATCMGGPFRRHCSHAIKP